MTSEPESPSPLLSPLLSGLEGVRHGFFTRRGGVSHGIYESLNLGSGSKDAPGDVTENRARVAAWFRAPPERLVTCYQVHSAEIHTLVAPPPDGRPQGDGLVTAQEGLVLGVLHADCAPVLLADPDARVICAVHAGWRGALGGVVEAGVEAMVRAGASRNGIRAAVGPCIGPASYEVGMEFLDSFEAQAPGSVRFFQPAARPEKRLFDLPAYVLDRLARAGVDAAEWIGMDTLGDERLFFSNRRKTLRGEPDYGRLISAIALSAAAGGPLSP